ncbi:ATP-dependent helicase HrpB [Dongia rigui]|uniref:ATP-dependent helicase HrpB n=1 Tax=Dongia rigui TaxID=940149 RepID=A0ABU5DXD3_9PROT|nr:ATP-dependent helicase HrpB [Dongia rigui]MDY0871979.1 ATP-dependent helicase HrpB [Dongia rigui]
MIARFDPLLPIAEVLAEIGRALEAGPNLVLEAPPGAGKTTQVPLALLDASWRGDGKIILLEPRRLAARGAAHRLAAHLDEAVGETAGYRVRLDRKIGPKTRIECVTTGLFLRQLQGDPELKGVAALIFDEFHERSVEADLALAFALEAQASLRPDLRLVVMSATLDGAAIAALMPTARRITSEGRAFPVTTHHLGDDSATWIEKQMAAAIRRALADEAEGDVLAFLPGLGEIRRTERELGGLADAIVLPLHGDLPLSDQDRAIQPDPQGRRKIVLATSIAESSLTIQGIRIVIDSGQRRVARFDPATGMTRLTTTKVSLANADQRRGRAGRLGPGTCYRLWSANSERALAPQPAPEIIEIDLAPLALELAAWGIDDPSNLPLLDPPPAAALAQARELLRELGALDPSHRITAHGRAMAELGLHPRLAHMLLIAKSRGLGALACDIAAILTERDIIGGPGRSADLGERLELLQSGGGDRGARARIQQAAKDWRRQLGIAAERDGSRSEAGSIVALAYPDRLAQQRGGKGQYRLASGRGAELALDDPLSRESYLAVATLDAGQKSARIYLAAPISLAEIEVDFASLITSAEQVAWNAREEFVEAKRERRLLALVLEEKPLQKPDPDLLRAATLDGIRQMGLDVLPWSNTARTLRARVAFLRRVLPEKDWPDWSDDALLASLPDWLGPHLTGMSRRAHLDRLDLHAALTDSLDWQQRQALEQLAPTHLDVPSGSRVPLDYETAEQPVLAVRLQEMFGATETPRIAGGRAPVLLHLLSPARRPVQVTQDLASFWKGAYKAVKSDLKGQYPKHYWPDDPLIAEPTARAKPRPR